MSGTVTHPKFSILVAWSDEDDAFVAVSPEWPRLSFVHENELVAFARLQSHIVEACRAGIFMGEVPPRPLTIHDLDERLWEIGRREKFAVSGEREK